MNRQELEQTIKNGGVAYWNSEKVQVVSTHIDNENCTMVIKGDRFKLVPMPELTLKSPHFDALQCLTIDNGLCLTKWGSAVRLTTVMNDEKTRYLGCAIENKPYLPSWFTAEELVNV